MQGSSTRWRASSRNGVAAGSVWETRMKMDEVQGGIKVFNGSHEEQEVSNADEEGMRVYQKLRRNQTDSIGEGRRKRRSWGVPEPADNFFIDKTPIQLRLLQDNDVVDEQHELEIGVEEESRNFDDKEIDQPVEKLKNVEDLEKKQAFAAVSQKIELQQNNVFDSSTEVEKKQNPLASPKIEYKPNLDVVLSQKFELQQNTVFVSSSEVEKKQNILFHASPNMEKKPNFDTVSPQKVEKQQKPVSVSSSEVEKKQNPAVEASTKIDKKRYSVFQAWSNLEKKQNLVASASRKRDKKQNSVTWTSVDADKKQNYVFSASSKKDNPVIETMKKTDLEHRKLSSTTAPQQVPSRESHGHHRMQSIVDMVMWENVQRSAFVFVFGTFFLICLSYAEDFNSNCISIASYLGLIYLASIFIYKSILNRSERIDYKERDERYMVGEEEAIWLLRLVLPYINELLLSLRALFSGDPATTMKLAVLMLVMAKCGSSITAWNLAKLTFLVVFIIPKLYSSYSNQLARQGECWLEMLKDGWQSSNHKKAIIIATFIVVWSISSTAARIWSGSKYPVARFHFHVNCSNEIIPTVFRRRGG